MILDFAVDGKTQNHRSNTDSLEPRQGLDMSCTINSVTQSSKRVFLPNHSIYSTAGYRHIKDAKNGLRAEK